jgi:rRNA-processing protein FCF1
MAVTSFDIVIVSNNTGRGTDVTSAMTSLLNFPVLLTDVILYLLLSAVVGVIVYGVVVFLRDVRSGEYQRPTRKPLLPVDATGWTLAVDGSNFAHRGEDVRLVYLEEVLDALKRRFENAEIRVFCDANLRYKFHGEDSREFLKLLKSRNSGFSETHGRKADEVLLKTARAETRWIVVSNDRFREDDDEIVLRIGVPLLKVRLSRTRIRPADTVDLFRDRARPFTKTSIPVGTFIHSS